MPAPRRRRRFWVGYFASLLKKHIRVNQLPENTILNDSPLQSAVPQNPCSPIKSTTYVTIAHNIE
jgi:hypothetical protein